MILCPECGEENPQGSKFCRKCGINLVYEEKTVKKATVISNNEQTNQQTRKTEDDDNKWCWGCCVCVFFLFVIFAIAGH